MKHAKLAAALAAIAISLAGCAREHFAPLPPGVHKRPSSAPISFYLDRRASDALELGAREACQLWTDATKFKFVYRGKVKARVARDGRDEIVVLEKWPNELPIGAPAWCQAYLDPSGAIVEADILLNAQAFAFTTKREAKSGALYIEDVLANEIGRALGLGAADEGQASAIRRAAPGDGYEPGIDPAEMAAYLSLYAADDQG